MAALIGRMRTGSCSPEFMLLLSRRLLHSSFLILRTLLGTRPQTLLERALENLLRSLLRGVVLYDLLVA